MYRNQKIKTLNVEHRRKARISKKKGFWSEIVKIEFLPTPNFDDNVGTSF